MTGTLGFVSVRTRALPSRSSVLTDLKKAGS